LPQKIEMFARWPRSGTMARFDFVYRQALDHHADGAPEHARVRVILAEDHESMRRSLRLLLDSEPDIEVVAETGQLTNAIRYVDRLRPEVLVLDLKLPTGSSMETVRRLRRHAPQTRIVVITMHDGHAFASHAHDAGALGFVLKDSADMELPDAVRCASRGELYTSPRVAPRLVPLLRP
jgi:two-component system, NarL family, response regulator NreC